MPIAHLRRFSLLRKLPDRELKRVLAISTTEDFEPGAPIFRKGEVARHIFVVISGRIKIYCPPVGRKRKTYAYLGPGDFFGEMGVLDGNLRSASAQAVAQSRVLILPRSRFRELLLSDSRLSYELLIALCARLRQADEEIESLLFRNILGRVAKTLWDLARLGAQRQGDGLVLRDRYTHQELADLVGTTREPLSRALALLKRAELVGSRQGRFFLPNPRKIQSLIS